LSSYADKLVKSEAEKTKRFVKELKSKIRVNWFPYNWEIIFRLCRKSPRGENGYTRKSRRL